MGPKKTKKDTKKSEKTNERDESPEVEPQPPVAGKIVLTRTTNDVCEVVVDLDILIKAIDDALGDYDRNQGIIGKQRHLYDLRNDWDAKKAILENSKRLDEEERNRNHRGRSSRSKAARATAEAAERLYHKYERQVAEAITSETRKDEKDAYMNAQGRLEDFLYYQVPGNRWKRMTGHASGASAALEIGRRRRRTPYLLANGEETHHEWLHPILDHYDALDIGTFEYRQGYIDAFGNNLRDTTLPPTVPLVGPRELHLWRSAMRRQPVGLGRDPSQWRHHRWNIRLDDKAVEARRAEVESAPHEDDPSHILTHEHRRRNEQQRYGRGTAHRPTTSNVRIEAVDGKQRTADYFDEIKTRSGLFIAAKESSWDWLTSYDCLGKVKTVRVPEVFPESREPNDKDWTIAPNVNDGKLPATKDGEETESVGGDEDDDYANQEPRELTRPRENVSEPGSLEPGRRIMPSRVAKEPKDGQDQAIETKEKVQPEPVQTKSRAEPSKRRKIRVNIDYSYPKNEFTRASRGLNIGTRRYEVTPWAEETTGRRERHDYRVIAPSSPVDSPPHRPLRSDLIKDSDIPAGFSLTESKPFRLEQGSRQKCSINPQRCRAWWNPHHSAQDCWVAYPEQPTRPDNPTRWPILAIDAPKESSDDYVPAGGKDIYRSRLHDHYGLVHHPKSKQHGYPWPRIGLRVPYEPMTFDDMRLGTPSGGVVATSKIENPGHGKEKAKEIHHAHLEEPRGTKRPVEDDHNPEHVGAKPSKILKKTHEHMHKKDENIRAEDSYPRTAHEMRSLAVPIIEAETRWGWFPDGKDYAHDVESPEESEDEGDLFTKEYEAGSFPEGRPDTPSDKAGQASVEIPAPSGESSGAAVESKTPEDPSPTDSSDLYSGPGEEPTKEPVKEQSSVTTPRLESGFLTIAEEEEFNMGATDEEVQQRFYGNKPAGGSGAATTSKEAAQEP